MAGLQGRRNHDEATVGVYGEGGGGSHGSGRSNRDKRRGKS